MVTQFVLRTDKKDSTGRCPVHLVVYFDGARLECATGEKCKLADWHADRQKFRASYPLAEEVKIVSVLASASAATVSVISIARTAAIVTLRLSSVS
jgi:hypothetical protein